MKVILFDTNPRMVEAWKVAFTGVEVFSVNNSLRIGNVDVRKLTDVDAVVSPANSFGIMTGGIDLVYKEMFGDSIEHAACAIASARENCQVPVGKAALLKTNHSGIPFMIMAPTMPNHRTPVPFTNHAYLAFRAALTVAMDHSHNIKTLACPGLCTASGGMYPMVAAQQMRRAYEEVMCQKSYL